MMPNAPSYQPSPLSKKRKAAGKLGGQARNKNVPDDLKTRISAKGGLVCYLKYGSEHYSKLAKDHWQSLTDEAKQAHKDMLRKALTKRWSDYRKKKAHNVTSKSPA